jgi:hypothetical protein
LEEPEKAMRDRCESYGFSTQRFTWVKRSEIDDQLAALGEPGAIPRATVAAMTAAAKEWAGILGPGAHAAAIAAAPLLELALKKVVASLMPRDKPSEHPRLIVLDSLNGLMNLLIRRFPFERPRLLFSSFCQALRKGLDTAPGRAMPVIIAIGEHHFHEPDIDKYLPESFFCDVEIVLRPEPVRVPRDHAAADKMTLGYDLGAIIEPDAKHVESRSFCRVVKARLAQNQSRRCAYDIEPNRGIRFYETYPGDGKLMLFAENEQQRASWRSFFQRDLTDAYPALRHELFTMAGMETVYESSRRLQNVPLRNDMFLSSLDSYWVVGYRDYRLKTMINARLQAKMLCDRETLQVPDWRDPKSSWACIQYPSFVNDLVYLAICTLERDLAVNTYTALNQRPRPPRERRWKLLEARLIRLDAQQERLKEEIKKVRDELHDRYDWLCRYLFNVRNVDELIGLPNKPTLLPPADLRETYLRPLPRSRIALFGQYNGDLLPSLTREDMHQFENGEDYWLSVPYDANIGVFVARIDLLRRVLRDGRMKRRFDKAFRRLKQDELIALRSMLAREDVTKPSKLELLLHDAKKGEVEDVARSIQDQIRQCEDELKGDPPPLPQLKSLIGADARRISWDQVICLSAAAGRPIGIETRTFDTLMALFLELVWNCGGTLEVNGRYEIPKKKESVLPLLRALHYFRAIFAIANTPTDQTIDPSHFHAGPGGLDQYGNWLFGRYWYSTLVDSLTATNPIAASKTAAGEQRKEFVWKNTRPGVELEIIKMPAGTAEAGHYSCWGEWNFALLAGSENVTLACDLISNLMGALKVTERGLRGACLPTVSQFYWRYRNEPCVPATIRSDLKLPKLTFGGLGKAYLGTPSVDKVKDPSARDPEGIFRQSIFDYRHCAREIFGELRWAKTGIAPEQIADGCLKMLRGIEELRDRYLFIRGDFRHDVAEMPLQGADRRNDWASMQWRPPRVPIDIRVGVRIEDAKGRFENIMLLNISRAGCCVAGKRPANARVAVKLDSRPELLGTVRPSGDGTTHIEFDRALTYQEFGMLLELFSQTRPQREPPRAPAPGRPVSVT